MFLRLAQIMNGLRTPNQCKSHHQKMQKVTKSGSVEEVISYLEGKYSLISSQDQKCVKAEDGFGGCTEVEIERDFKLNVSKMRNWT